MAGGIWDLTQVKECIETYIAQEDRPGLECRHLEPSYCQAAVAEKLLMTLDAIEVKLKG